MPRFSPAAFRRVVRASAVYDVLATAAFATPWTFAWNWRQLSELNVRLGGVVELVDAEGRGVFVALMKGSDVRHGGAAPLEDALLVIADDAEMGAASHHLRDERFLGWVDVLVLIDDQVP